MSKVTEVGFQRLLEHLKFLERVDDVEYCKEIFANSKLYIHITCRTNLKNAARSKGSSIEISNFDTNAKHINRIFVVIADM